MQLGFKYGHCKGFYKIYNDWLKHYPNHMITKEAVMKKMTTKEECVNKVIVQCPIVDISSYWIQTSIELLKGCAKKARKAGNMDLLRKCNKRLQELQKKLL